MDGKGEGEGGGRSWQGMGKVGSCELKVYICHSRHVNDRFT